MVAYLQPQPRQFGLSLAENTSPDSPRKLAAFVDPDVRPGAPH